MIRTYAEKDLEAVMDLWLNGNLQAHSFISEKYWKEYYPIVKKQIPQSEVYVWESGKQIFGFIGLDNGYIAGLFVSAAMRSKGIGKELLNYCKSIYPLLKLHVYKKNRRAFRFYIREGFMVNSNQTDAQTGEEEYNMLWRVF